MFRSSDRRSYSHKSRFAALLASSALISNSILANAVLAQSLPTGGQVAAGSASIGAPSNGAMTINQNSNSAVINWQSFNIGQNNSVTFIQPDASSAILNRVTGSTSTTIAGALNANGQVYLVNPNGIAITSTGTINTGAFVASTLGISDEDFMSGRRTFTGNGASAPVSNAGTITINRGGYMALIGGTVANSGVINVPMGKAALGSGEQATLDISGDGFLQVAIPTRAEGTNPLVSNSGRISARGGTVQLSAAAARDMARQAINMSGTIEAKGVAGKSGDITLFGGDGEVAVSGRLNARNNRGTGGKITVTGRKVALAGAKIDASGRTGGGTINIGGERQGKGTLKRAETLSVDANTVIKADALKSGNGGNIVLWSDNLTNFAGTITARGGADAGNGGEVEVSGKEKLVYTGFTDLSAPKGSLGNLLLDPYNVIISNGTDTSGFTANGNDSVINVNTLVTALSAANVTVSTGSSGTQAGTITVADPLAWASGSTLTLNAASDININAAINAPSGGLSLTSGGTISATAGVNVATFALNAGNWVQNNATLPSFYAKDFQINGGSFLRVTGGDGTSGTPYQLADIYGLQGVGSSPAYLQASWALANDIDASGTVIWNAGAGFNPIGNGSAFSGSFDGGGHVISGLTINRPTTDSVGLIGSLSGTANPSVRGIVRNIGLSGGSITGGSKVGGLVGYAEQASISNAWSSARVTGGGSSIGGLVGQNYATALSNSYATGAVTGSTGVGGLVGLNEGTITGSYATGAVSGLAGIGGLVGGMQTRGPTAAINTSYATGAVAVATNGSGGGLAGYVTNGIIGQSYASGAVNGLAGAYVGGLVGFAQNATINQSYATGSTSTSGAGYAGGLIGMAINATINQTYATGAVSAASGYAGGFVGSRSGGSYANSYFDTQTTGQAIAVAMGPSDTVLGLTSAQARDKSNYTGWDFNSVWYQSGDMRPILRAEAASAAADGYIPISNLNQLALMGANPTANYKLATDLNATATSGTNAAGIWSTSGWVPVETFFGTLDGQNHTISNLYINRPSTDGVGLFANVSGWNTPYPGTIRNIGLVGGSITGRTNVGALIGVSDTASISNVWSSANVTGNGKSIGGLVGFNYWTTISDSRTSGTVTGNSGASDIGGLVGLNQGVINRSYATGAVNAISMATDGGVGGLVGFMQSNGSAAQVNASYATGNVTASGGAAGTQAGGLVGRMISATVNQSYATGNVSSTATGSLSNSGGLVGRAQSSTVNQSYATGSAYSANGFAAGLVGYLITNGMVNESYATGYVSGGNGSAGLVGYIGFSSTAQNSYFDVNTTGRSNDISYNVISTVTNVFGLNTAQLRDKSNYAGWDFNSVWYQNGDMRPILRAEAAPAGADGYVAISNLHQLALMGANVGGNYKLVADIDASPTTGGAASGIWSTSGWMPIGDPTNGMFSGTLDGQNHTIANLWINRPGTDFVGLFGKTYHSTIRNVGLVGGTVIGKDAVGALAGQSDGGSIQNVYAANVAVSGQSYTGGLVGLNSSPISGAYATGNVTGGQYVGGLVGSNFGSITNAYATGNVSGTTTGGLVGLNQGTIENAYATGTASGGGLVGLNLGVLTNSFWNTQTSGRGNACGTNMGPLCSATGLNTAQMKDPFTFIDAGWDFASIWATPKAGAAPVLRGMTAAPIYNYYARIAGDLSTTYGDIAPANNVPLQGVGTNNLIVNWGSAISGSTNVGTYAWNGANVFSFSYARGSASDYYIAYGSGGLTVTPRTITVVADAQSKTYGDANPNLTYTVTGLVNNNTLSGSLSTPAGQFSGVGTYAINQGSLSASSNYIINYTGADLSVTPKAITVAADAQSKVYGDANPSLTYTATGLVNNDTLSGDLSTSAGQFSSVGAYAINQGSLAASSNYTITYTGAALSVTPRTITIVADAQSKVYGDLNPSFTYTATGLVNNDILNGSLSASTDQFSGVGVYAIGLGSLFASNNYTINYMGADLSITPRAISVAAHAQSKIYGDANPSLTYTATGLFGNDTLSGSLSTAAGQYSGVGTYAINQGTLANPNYAISYTSADLSVTPKAITVAADAQSKVYGDANPNLSYVATGLVNNDTLSGSLSTAAGQFSGVGTYAINQGSLANANYTISYTSADLSVTPKAITVAADAQSKVYGDVNPNLSYVATGLVNNDTLSGSLSTSAGQFSGVGAYAINQGSLANANYTISYTGADLSVTPRTITVVADAQSKTYGDVNPSLTYVATGLINNDTLSGLLSTSAGQFSGVGAYAINQGTLANANYTITYTGADLSVTPKAITVAADAQSKVYGDVNPNLSYVATGLVNNDTLSGSLSTSAGQFSGVGAYAINQGTLANGNYAITYTGADLSVTPKAITVAADAQSKVYGDVNPNLTYVATGLVNNDTLSGTLLTSAGQFSGVGAYAINQGTLANANYTITYTGADLSVTPKAITVAADAQSKIYGDVNPNLTYVATGLVNNDTLSGSLSTGAGQFSGVGTYGIYQGTLANANYTIIYTGADLSITPKAITVAADAQSKVYGDVNPSLTYTATGLVNNDTLSGALSTAAGQFSGVGAYAINQGTLANANYTITYTGADLSITPKAITVAADSQSKVYGDVNPSLTYTATGLVNNDTLSGSLSTSAGQFSGVGTYAINQGSLANANYMISYTSADLSVTPKAITVVADSQSKIYGDVNPSFTYTATGLVNNDTLNGSLSTGASQFSGVGTYAINQGSLANANYTISYTSADLSVAPKAITVVADAQSKVYGDVNPAFTYIATGLVNNDTLNGSLSTAAGQFSGVGTYAINQGSLANANYTISYSSADLSVTPKAITVVADAQSKIYGDVNPSLTYMATGLVNNDTLSGSLSTAAGQFSGVGTYAINQGSLANANYTISYSSADLSITPKMITVVADAQSKIYGDVNPSLTYTATGLVNNDTLNGSLSTGAGQFSNVGAYAINQGSLANANYTISYTAADLSVTPKAITVVADSQGKIYGDVNPSFTYTATGLVNNDTLSGGLSTSAGQFSGVGTYAINQGSLANANYTISYTSADLSVTPKAITVVADAQSKIYGDVNPNLTYVATGLVNNDALNGSLSTSAGQFSGVGTYAINQGTLANANYTISYTAADLSVTPKAITVVADTQSKIYGDVNPNLTYVATGLVNNDTLSGSLSTSASQFSGVGAYAINQGSLANANYTISYTSADMSITPKTITVVADAQSKIYGDVNPSLSYTATGLVNNDTLSGGLSTAAGQFSGVGIYAINQGSLANANYTISYTSADLSVTPKAITVVADSQSKIYGDVNPSLTYTATGLVNNDTLNGSLSTAAGQFSGVGTYAINQGSLANANYAISYTGADLSVTPRAITVVADSQSKIYGDVNPTLTYTATGLVNNDTLNGSLSTAAGQFSGVGTYAINQGSLANANYAISYAGADLSVTPKAITVVADSQSKIYGDVNPALTYTATGLVNNDTLNGSLSTAAGQFSGVGTYAINQGSLANANYAISYTSGDLSVTPKTITIVADAQSKIYGDINPALTYTATGLVNNDMLSGSLLTGAGQYSGVGTYAINLGTLVASNNYTINYTGADLSVTPRAITVAADAQSKIYGDVNPSLSYTATGLVNNDTLNGSLSTAAGQFSGVGTYAINQGTLANANYTISYTSADLSVMPKAITVVADSQSKIYGDVNPSFTYTATGLVNNDTLSGSLSSAAGQFSGVGAYTINQGSLANANYTISYTSADLSVTPKAITVVADAQSKIYGDVNPSLTYTATGLVNNDTLSGSLLTGAGQYSGVGTYAINQGSLANVNYTISYTSADLSVTPKAITVVADAQSKIYGDVNPALSYTATGLVNNDTLNGSLSTSAGQFSGVGAYAIDQGSLANANYTINYTNADLSVTPKAITVTADAQSKIYGDVNPSLTYSATGLVNNDTLNGSLSTGASQFSGVGIYTINQGSLANANYAISYTGADLSVMRKAITVVADAQSKIYGDVNPALTYTATGLVNNDTLNGSPSTAAGRFSSVGAYAINQGSLANANYAISYTGADLSVTPKTITVAADAQSKIYGDLNPSLTYTATGLVNGDTLTGALSTAAGQYSNVGSYAINQGSVSASSNYAISYTGADLTVNQRDISVLADSVSRRYGFANPALTYRVGGAGLVNGDTLIGILATSATSSSLPGSYAIAQGTLAASANYRMSFIPGILTVEMMLNIDSATRASSVATTFDPGRVAPTRPVSATGDDADGHRILMTDPRFEGTMLCSDSRVGCSTFLSQARP